MYIDPNELNREDALIFFIDNFRLEKDNQNPPLFGQKKR